MPAPIPVAILGFSAFDRKALAAYLQKGRPGRPAFDLVLSVDNADLVVADADEPGVIALLDTLGRTSDALFIGAQAPAQAAAWMMRPLDQAQVLRELDALVAQRSNPDSQPLPLSLPSSLGQGVLRQLGSANLPDLPASADTPDRRQDSAGAGPRAAYLQQAQEARRLEREALNRPQIVPRVLLVDDSEVALHFMARQLQGYGLTIDMARHSDRALDLLTHHAYGIVFLDLDLGEQSRQDGLTLCHQIRYRLMHPGGRAPMVVMVSAFHDAVHQVRGTLAGAEGYLGKPLDMTALDRLLSRQGLFRQGLGAANGPVHRRPSPR